MGINQLNEQLQAAEQIPQNKNIDELLKQGNEQITELVSELGTRTAELKELIKGQPDLEKELDKYISASYQVASTVSAMQSLSKHLEHSINRDLARLERDYTYKLQSLLSDLVIQIGNSHDIIKMHIVDAKTKETPDLTDIYESIKNDDFAEKPAHETPDENEMTFTLDEVEQSQPQPVATVTIKEHPAEPATPDLAMASNSSPDSTPIDLSEELPDYSQLLLQEDYESNYKWPTNNAPWRVAANIIRELFPSNVGGIMPGSENQFRNLARNNIQVSNRLLYYINDSQNGGKPSLRTSGKLENLVKGNIVTIPSLSELRDAILLPEFKKQLADKGYDQDTIDQIDHMPIGQLPSGQLYFGKVEKTKEGKLTVSKETDLFAESGDAMIAM